MDNVSGHRPIQIILPNSSYKRISSIDNKLLHKKIIQNNLLEFDNCFFENSSHLSILNLLYSSTQDCIVSKSFFARSSVPVYVLAESKDNSNRQLFRAFRNSECANGSSIFKRFKSDLATDRSLTVRVSYY